MKIEFQIAFLVFHILFTSTVEAQHFYYEKTGQEYEINQNTDKKIINEFLKNQKATALEFNPNINSNFPFRIKNKNENWMLFHASIENIFKKRESQKYSFQFPTPVMERSGLTLANRKGKIYLINIFEKNIESKMRFDQVIIKTKKDTLYRYDHKYDEDGNLIYQENESAKTVIDKIAVKKGNKWGLIELADGEIYLSRNFLYNSPEAVPEATGFQSYQLEMMENIRKEHNVDLLVALDENGYYFKARNKKTKLFGIFVGEGEAYNQIPTKYTNIIRHRNPETFEVWRGKKVGYYNSSFHLVFEPTFDDFEFVHLDYTHGCALKINGKWSLYSTQEPIKLIEGSADRVDQLIELWLNR